MPYEHLKAYVNQVYPHLSGLITECQYEQIAWIDATHQTNERVPGFIHGQALALQQQRIFSRLHFLYLLRAGDEQAYHRFVKAQREPQLTEEHFYQLAQYIVNLSPREYQQLWVAALTSKSEIANQRAAHAFHPKKPPFDAVEFLARVMRDAPRVFPAAAELLQNDDTAESGWAVMFDTGHFRHMMYGEGGLNMFRPLINKIRKGQISQNTLNLWFSYWLIDIAGFRAQTKEQGSEYLGEYTFRAMIDLKQHLDILVKDTSYPILLNYLSDRARWVGIEDVSVSSDASAVTSNLILGRIAAMQRLFTPDQKPGLQNGLRRLEEKMGKDKFKEMLQILNPLTETDEPTATFGPALLANLRDKRDFEEAIVIGLPVYATALESYRRLRAEHRIDPSLPLNFNSLSGVESIKALLEGKIFSVSINPEDGTSSLKLLERGKKIAFLVSSLGDTDLAKATIHRLLDEKAADAITLIPLTTVALKRTEEMRSVQGVCYVPLTEITQQQDVFSQKKIDDELLDKVISFLHEANIQHAAIGVPSPIDEVVPYQIASRLSISFTMIYEFMFRPQKHAFWQYVGPLSQKRNCKFAVPLHSATHDFQHVGPSNIDVVGHLSIDRALSRSAIDIPAIKHALNVNAEELIFISGTTQPHRVDVDFVNALLSELATGNYPNLQIRFGIHPGIVNPDKYLSDMLEVCSRHESVSSQFKFILPKSIKEVLKHLLPAQHPFILESNISGTEAAQAADKVAQAVPGALLNEAAVKGVPVYSHDQEVLPYLPGDWFSKDIGTFFGAKPSRPHSLGELGLTEPAHELFARVITR